MEGRVLKRRITLLLCLTLCLSALFGCAKEAEESIPEGWVEYDLPDVGIKIALPPHYVAAAEGLAPTDADYERAGGVKEKTRESFEDMFDNMLGKPYINFCAISAKTLGGGLIAMGDAPKDVQAFGADTTNSINVDRYAELVYEGYKTKDYDMDYYGNAGGVIGSQLCYAVFEIYHEEVEGKVPYVRKYVALFKGKKIELEFLVSKEYVDSDQISEFDEIAKTLEVY